VGAVDEGAGVAERFFTPVETHRRRARRHTDAARRARGRETAQGGTGSPLAGGEGSVIDRLERVSEGVYRSTHAIPVYGNWKVTLRLHKGAAAQGAAVYFPEDPALPAKAIPAGDGFTRPFLEDKKLLQREQKSDVPGFLTAFAYLTVLAIGLGLVAALTAGLARLDRTSATRRAEAATGTTTTEA
jgi:hypothetical protein